MLLTLLLGCVRSARFLIPDHYVVPDEPQGQLAEVHVTTGYPDEPEAPYVATTRTLMGTTYIEPYPLTSDGSLRVVAIDPHATVSIWLRHTGLTPTDFEPVTTVTGAVPGRVPLEVRPIPRRLDEPLVLPLHQLHNVYNGYRFEDEDLLLLQVESPGEEPERYLFRTRRIGFRTRFGIGVLVRSPFPEPSAAPFAPVFAGTLAVGYRPRTRSQVWSWLGDKAALVGSVGVGNTHLPTGGDAVGAELGTLYDAALVGGGVELYDIVSVQVLANLHSLWRDASEARGTVVVGFDAVQFARFTSNAGQRLLYRNELDRP